MSDDIDFRMERSKLLERVRLEKGWTKKHLAERAGYDEKTLYNLLSGGDVQTKTIFDFCQALGIEMPSASIRKVEVADDELGGYTRSIYSDYEGNYYVYRPSFSKPDQIYKYLLNIAWDDVESSFRFKSYYKLDAREPAGAKTHGGPVSISALTNLVHFTVTFKGSIRLVTVTKMRRADGIMRGSMLTHFEDLNFFRPTLAPIVLKKIGADDHEMCLERDIRLLDEASEEWSFAREQLDLTETSVLNLCFPPRR